MKKRYLIAAAAAASLLFCGLLLYLSVPKFFSTAQTHAKFEQFLNEFFRAEISSSTLSLHYTVKNPDAYGITTTSVTFGDFSVNGRAREHSLLNNTQKSLTAFSRQALSKEDRFTYDLLSSALNSAIALSDYELFEEPFLPNNGVHAQLPILLAEYPFYEKSDVDDYLSLLGEVDSYFLQLLDFEEEKAKAGFFMSDSQCETVLEACESFLKNQEDNLLLRSFESRIADLSGITESERQSYIDKNREMFYAHVVPAYESVINRLSALLGLGRNDWGICNYADGADYYALLVSADTGTSEDIDTLFEKIASAREKDLSTCAAILLKHPEYASDSFSYNWDFSDETDMLDTLQNAMQSDFPAITEVSYRLSYVDESLEASLAPAFYITAPIDDPTNNAIYINRSKSDSDISYFTTLAHEGFPGHLYQTVMSYSYGMEPMRAVLDYPGYTEGWATYTEIMSYSYAGLPDDLATLLSCNQSATLSLYASSDIGIHYYGWEMEELSDFWADYGITNADVISDIADLVLGDPGNYLNYYVGYLKFEELRDEMAEKYGDSFSLSDFHEALLMMGPAPFDLLLMYFPDYYAAALG